VGTVWLVRQPEGSEQTVVAFTAECPHLGCAIGLGGDGKAFFCPCHQSAFRLDGTPSNAVPPRGMDTLEVEHVKDPAARISVRFERFRTQTREKTPLA
jgi:menaquinol-cytochrome c reductase iron-sulfur subunit